MRLINIIIVSIIMTGLLAGCASNNPNNRGLQAQSSKLTIDEYYRKIKRNLDEKKLDSAAEVMRSMEIRFPFNDVTHDLQLELASAYGSSFDAADATKAIYMSNRFIAQYPYHQKIDRAYYIRAMANFNQGTLSLDPKNNPDTNKADPRWARESFKNFADLVRRFPESLYQNESKQRMLHLRKLLAEYEVSLAKQALENNDLENALKRARYVVDNYPSTAAYTTALNIIVEVKNAPVASATTKKEGAATSVVAVIKKAVAPTVIATRKAAIATEARLPQNQVTEYRPVRSAGLATKPTIRSESWLLEQDPFNYTIQMAGTTQKGGLDKFFERQTFSGDAASYTSLRKGVAWYLALYGSYPSNKAAQRAARELESMTGIKDLWVRRYKDIHKDIQKTTALGQ